MPNAYLEFTVTKRKKEPEVAVTFIPDACVWCESCRDVVDQMHLTGKSTVGRDVYTCEKGHENAVKLRGDRDMTLAEGQFGK